MASGSESRGQESGKYGKIKWALSTDGTITLSGKGDLSDFNKATGESPTVEDRPWAKYREQINCLVVRDGITGIGARAFQGCKNLRKAEFAPSVRTIGGWAFQNCRALKDVSIGENTMVKTGAFRGTPVLATVKAAEKSSYTDSEFYRALCEVRLSGNFRSDMIAIALSQLGYHEGDSEADFDGGNPSSKEDYTEFGRFMDSAGSAWCSEFASWCVRMSGLPMNILSGSRSARAKTFTSGTPSSYYTWSELSYGGGGYMPQAGDIVLWSWNLDPFSADKAVSHTSVFKSAEISGNSVTLYTIDGNKGNKVKETSYTVSLNDGLRTDGKGRVCFIVSPAYDHESIEKLTVSFDCSGGKAETGMKTVAKGGLYGPLPIPRKGKSRFLGWFTAPEGGEPVNMYTPVKSTQDHTLYARWK